MPTPPPPGCKNSCSLNDDCAGCTLTTHTGTAVSPSPHQRLGGVQGSSTVWVAVRPDNRRQRPIRAGEVRTHRLWDHRFWCKPRPPPPLWLLEAPVRKIILQMHTPARSSQCWSWQTQHGLGVCIWMHLVNSTGNSPSPGQPTLEQSNRTSHPKAPLTQPKHVRTHRGSE